MTPEDIDFIKGIGNGILVGTTILIVHTSLYGIFALLFCISTAISIRRGLTTRIQWTMLTISIICFALFSLYWIDHVVRLIILVKSMLVENIALPEAENYGLYVIKTQMLEVAGEIITELFPIISDMIVVWRAWAIFPSQRRWMIAPVVLLIGTIVITVVHLLSFYNCVPALLNNRHNRALIDGLFTSAVAASIATNLTATLLISYNLWDHRRRVSGNLGRQRSQGEKVLAILVESGAIYCAVQVVTLALQFPSSDSDKHLTIANTYNIFNIVYVGASAMYPVVVIVLIRLQLSFEHTYGFSLVSRAQAEHEHRNISSLPTIGQLRFASAPGDSREQRGDMGES